MLAPKLTRQELVEIKGLLEQVISKDRGLQSFIKDVYEGREDAETLKYAPVISSYLNYTMLLNMLDAELSTENPELKIISLTDMIHAAAVQIQENKELLKLVNDFMESLQQMEEAKQRLFSSPDFHLIKQANDAEFMLCELENLINKG